jgi:hypothetical protein
VEQIELGNWTEREIEIAKRICAAFQSYQMGVGLGYYYNQHLKDRNDQIGDLWLVIARLGDQLLRGSMEEFLERITPKGPKTIQ